MQGDDDATQTLELIVLSREWVTSSGVVDITEK